MSHALPDVSELLNTAARQSTSEVGNDLRDAFSRLMDEPTSNREALIMAIAEALPSVSSGYGAGTLAIWLGAQVEHGRDPNLSFDAVRRTWLRWSNSIQVEDASQQATGPEGAFYAIEDCSRSLVSHCAAADQLFKKLQADRELRAEVTRLFDDSAGAAWLDQLFNQANGEVLVLDMANQRGAMLRYRNLSNCFHLFTLLQGALQDWLPLDKRPAQSVLDRALGKSDESIGDYARWHFQQPRGVTPNLARSVWGEGHPGEIESVEGQQIVLLWPVVLKHRGWDDGFFMPQLHTRPPCVEVIRELLQTEFESWRDRLIRLSPREPTKSNFGPIKSAKKRWWMFWRK